MKKLRLVLHYKAQQTFADRNISWFLKRQYPTSGESNRQFSEALIQNKQLDSILISVTAHSSMH